MKPREETSKAVLGGFEFRLQLMCHFGTPEVMT